MKINIDLKNFRKVFLSEFLEGKLIDIERTPTMILSYDRLRWGPGNKIFGTEMS